MFLNLLKELRKRNKMQGCAEHFIAFLQHVRFCLLYDNKINL